MNANSKISQARKKYHANLLQTVLTVSLDGIPSNADKDSKLSVRIAKGIADILESETGERLAAQSSGSAFETCNSNFLRDTFLALDHIRPGNWEIKKIGNRNRLAIAEFEQYAHLIALDIAAKSNPELAASLGNDYTITPDIIIIQHLLQDDIINQKEEIVDLSSCRLSSLRAANGGNPLLHASISSKWTIRSDRSQNSRSEALNIKKFR